MSLVVATVSGESEEEEEVRFSEDFVSRTASSSEDAALRDNCLNGIKWPPEHYKKKGRKGGVVFNGFQNIKRTLVTHGGRRSKLPKRFRDSDSESDSSMICAQTKDAGERVEGSALKGRDNKICKNGRMNSLIETKDLAKSPRMVRKHRPLKQDLEESVVLAKNDEFADRQGHGDENSNSTAGYSVDSAHKYSKGLKRISKEICSENDILLNVPKKKRGRKPKRPRELGQSFANNGSTEQNAPHGNGDCVSNATKTRLASPSVSNCAIAEKKLKDGVRKRKNGFVSTSSEESNTDCPMRKRRGRPPKYLSPKFEAKHEIFNKNGIRKPWARPLLKTVDKRSLFRSPRKPLNNKFISSGCSQTVSEVKPKLVPVNGFVTSLQSENQIAMPKRRGRPPKIKKKQFFIADKDVFQFTDEEASEGKQNLDITEQVKKLKLSRKFNKRPLAPGKPRKLERKKTLVKHLKLKKKAVENAKRTLKIKKKAIKKVKSVKLFSEAEVGQNSDSAVHPIHRKRRNKIDRVLGMRRQISGEYEYLVQFKDGTSSWTETSQLVDYDPDIQQFLSHSRQDLPVINRLIFKAYWQENLHKKNQSWFESELDALHSDRVTSSCDNNFNGANMNNLEGFNSSASGDDISEDESASNEVDVSVRTSVCKEVTVQRIRDSLHIIVNRCSSKRLKTNHRILDSLTIALEDASEDDSLFVVIRGLGSEIFCGLDIKTVMEVPPEQESRYYRKDMDKLRYLVQTICNFPKPVVAAIKNPAEGLGAGLVALCDMVCDENNLKESGSMLSLMSRNRIPYCFPRLMSHSPISEKILMGDKVPMIEKKQQEVLREGVFSGARFTLELSSTIKAMAKLSGNKHRGRQSREELKHLEKVKKELDEQIALATDCIKDVSAFWNELTSSS